MTCGRTWSKSVAMRPDVVQLTRTLISVDTVSPPGNERILAVRIAEILHEYGLEATIQDIGDNRANLICEYGSGNGTCLVLNGHLDTVPAEGQWRHDPFDAHVEDGLMYGRGACDMKGGLAAMMSAFIGMAPLADRLDGIVRLVFVADEEDANRGSRHFLAHDRRSCKRNLMVIGEPTGLSVCCAHFGAERFWIRLHGRSAHSSRPEEGANAILAASSVASCLEGYHHELRSRKTRFGSPSAAVTLIEGGEKQNSIPVLCSLFLDRRTVPGEDGGQVAKEVEQWIASHADMHGCTCSVEPFFSFASGLLDERSGFLGKAKEIVGQQTDLVFPAGCEQAIFISGGYDAIVLGPGSIEMAHKIDEYVPLEELEKAVEIYEKFISILLDQSSCAIG